MKYKIGDAVFIRTDIDSTITIGCGFVHQMEKYRGLIATIIGYNLYDSSYEINLDKGYWSWSDSMFVPFPNNSKRNIDVICLKCGEVKKYNNSELKFIMYGVEVPCQDCGGFKR